MSASDNLENLLAMGFPQNRAERALSDNNGNLEQAMDYLLAHADEEMPEATPSAPVPSENPVQDPVEKSETKKDPEGDSKSDESPSAAEASEVSGETAKSIKCEDCGRLFRTQLEVEFHATKSGHLNFSESTEEKKPLTEEEKKQQLLLLEEKMKQKRKEREEREKQEAQEKERLRIKSGKDLSEIRRKMDEDEMKKIVEERKREKQEEKMARERVRAQIEADKAARRAKADNSNTPPTPTPSTSSTSAKPITETFTPQKEYKETKIQLRLPNGTSLVETFDKNETLAAVRVFICTKTQEAMPNVFSFMTSFPRKVFTDEDFEMTLESLKLVPSATIIVTKKPAGV